MAVSNEKLTAQDVMLDQPVIPVIVLNDVAHAVPMAKALVAGGIRMLEITLRTSVARVAAHASPFGPEPTMIAFVTRRRLGSS